MYTGCSSCHGAGGEGGVGYAFADGEVLKTFPHIEDQLRWVYVGTDAYVAAGVDVYGNPDRAGGAHVTRRKVSCRDRVPSSAARSPRRRSSLSSATSGTRSAGPTRRVPARRSSTTGAPRLARRCDGLEDGSATFDNIDTEVTGAITGRNGSRRPAPRAGN